MSDPTLTSTLLLTAAEADALHANPVVGLQGLHLERLTPIGAALQERTTDPFLQYMMVIIVNRTADTLVVDEATCPYGGALAITATDLAAGTAQLSARPDEFAPGAAIAGVWMVEHTGHLPSFVAKFDGTPSTGGHPLYVGGDLTGGVFGAVTHTATAANDGDHGSASDFYDAIVSKRDYGKSAASSGAVSVTGANFSPETTFGVGVDTDNPWWLVVATVR